MNLHLIAIIIKSTGALLIIIATLILTIKIAQIDRQILSTRDEIDSHLSQTKSNVQMMLFYEMKYIKYQMDIFQHNVLASLNAPQSAINHLNKRMEHDMGKIAESWKTLWAEEDYSEIREDVKNEVDNIINNSTLTHNQKLDKLEAIWVKAVNSFDEKMNEHETIFDSNKKLKLEYEKKRIFWNNLFIWFQICGLIIILFSEVFDKIGKNS